MKEKFETTAEQKVVLYKIASKMLENGDYSAQFVTDAIDLANKYKHVYDLMTTWEEDEAKVAIFLREAIESVSVLIRRINEVNKHKQTY
jgi:hypothetical protein